MRQATTRTRKSNTSRYDNDDELLHKQLHKTVTKHKHSESFKWLGQNPSLNTNILIGRDKIGRSVRICVCILLRVLNKRECWHPKTLKQLDNTLCQRILHGFFFSFFLFLLHFYGWIKIYVEILVETLNFICFVFQCMTQLKSGLPTFTENTNDSIHVWAQTEILMWMKRLLYGIGCDNIEWTEIYITNHWPAHQLKRANNVLGLDELV